MSKLNVSVAILCGTLLIVLFGCSAFQDIVTPCWIESDAKGYANVDANDFIPWDTVAKADKVTIYMNYWHILNQLRYARLAEDDVLEYKFLNELQTFHKTNALELQSNLFNPDGPIGLLLPTLLGIGLGKELLSSSKDKKKIETLKNGNGDKNG